MFYSITHVGWKRSRKCTLKKRVIPTLIIVKAVSLTEQFFNAQVLRSLK
jgi:hypothetical protein